MEQYLASPTNIAMEEAGPEAETSATPGEKRLEECAAGGSLSQECDISLAGGACFLPGSGTQPVLRRSIQVPANGPPTARQRAPEWNGVPDG